MATAAAARSTANRTAATGAARAQMSQMTVFVWQGTDKRGVKLKGEVLAKNENLAKADLRKQGINVGSVRKKPKPLFGAAGKTITAKDIAIFSRQIATMMGAGVPLVQSFDIIAAGQNNQRMKDLLLNIKADIEGGSSLAEALEKHPVQFDELYVNLVKAGETAGVLDTLLNTIATYKENIEALKSKIKKALFYPTMVVAIAILVTIVLMVFVIPQFQQIFQSFGADLPAFTLMVIRISEWFQANWWFFALVIGGTIGGIIFAKKRSRKVAHTIDRLTLKIPIIGQILNNAAIARFARTLAITFKAGVPLVDGLETTAGATGNIVYAEAVQRIRQDVSVGYQLNMAMRQVDLFPHMVLQMTAIGEEAGALDTMLNKVADFYEAEVNNAVDTLSQMLEPLIMVILGVLVGGLVIAMYLPIFKLAAAI